MPCGRCVKDDARKMRILRAFRYLHHAADGNRLVHPRRQRIQQLAYTRTSDVKDTIVCFGVEMPTPVCAEAAKTTNRPSSI